MARHAPEQPYRYAHDAKPEPGDAQHGDYTAERLVKMDTAFSAAMQRALSRRAARTDDDDGGDSNK
jgi:hypothetical protein